MTHKYSIRQNILVLLWNRSLIWNSWGQKSHKYCFICICVTFHQVVEEKIIFQAAAILNCLIWRHHWELALAPRRFGQSISKITSVPIFMLLYKFAHSLMRIPLTALTSWCIATTPATQTAWIERSVASATLSIYLHKNSTVCLSASAV